MEKKKQNHNYKARFFIVGFNSKINEIILDKKHIFQKGEDVDLDKIYNLENYNEIEKHRFFLDFEYSSTTKGHSKIAYSELEKINFFFEVFYNGNIKIKHFPLLIQLKKEGDFKPVGFYWDSKVFNTYEKSHDFGEIEIKNLTESWNKFSSIDETVNKTFKIARNRFLFSTLKYSDEDKLIDLMISFEAMFLDVTEKGELNYKLALRVSRLLEKRYDNMEVFDFVKKSYNLRSNVVHGSNIKSNEIKFQGKKLSLESVVAELHQLMKEIFTIYIDKYNDKIVSEFIKDIDTSIINN